MTTVYYGLGDKYNTRTGVKEIKCNPGAFGDDPLPNQKKECFYVVDPKEYLWGHCAVGEDQKCTLSENRLVRYGAGSNWVYSSFSGTTPCKVETFGSDPIEGAPKSCQVGIKKGPH
jgi:hypothetical protein